MRGVLVHDVFQHHLLTYFAHAGRNTLMCRLVVHDSAGTTLTSIGAQTRTPSSRGSERPTRPCSLEVSPGRRGRLVPSP